MVMIAVIDNLDQYDHLYEWATNEYGPSIESGKTVWSNAFYGPPKATDRYSVDQLTRIGMVGVYRKRDGKPLTILKSEFYVLNNLLER
jgi:hypothetical protein